MKRKIYSPDAPLKKDIIHSTCRKTSIAALACAVAAAAWSAMPPAGGSQAGVPSGSPTLAALESQFANPPAAFGVNCWWWWLNGNTDRDAIRSELAAMKSRRFQGAMVFDAGGQCQGGHRDIPAGPVFGGKDWCDLACEFRVVGRVPELWNPRTGEIRELGAFTMRGGVTSVPLRFDPFGAYFIVFKKPSGKSCTAKSNFADCTVAATLEGSWKVSFDPKWDGPEEVEFPSLVDWTENADERIRYYSGKATYRKRFKFAKKSGVRYTLRLGDVKDVGFARVQLNGRDLGVTWTPPFRLDATAALVDGENELEVMVVNSWYNRVKGDQLHPDRRQHTKTNIRLVGGKGNRNPGLSPSGLSPSGFSAPSR